MKTYRTVAALLDRRDRWTKNTYARSVTGRSVGPFSPRAVCFCLTGAIDRVYPDIGLGRRIRTKLQISISKLYGTEDIVGFNDDPDTTFTMVRKAVRLAKI